MSAENENFGKLVLTQRKFFWVLTLDGAKRVGCGRSNVDCQYRVGGTCQLTPKNAVIVNNYVEDDTGNAIAGWRPGDIECGGMAASDNGGEEKEDPLLQLYVMFNTFVCKTNLRGAV